MITPDFVPPAPVAVPRPHRIAARVLLAGYALIAIVILAAQYDPGRFVYVQPLRGAAVVCALILAAPCVAVIAINLAQRDQKRERVLKDSVLLFVLAGITLPVAFVGVTWSVDDYKDYDVKVVAVSPDGKYEVVSAGQRVDSGDSRHLRARSRDGLLSRSTRYPLASLCGELIDARFTGPDELRIVTRSYEGDHATTAFTARFDRRTLQTTEWATDCPDYSG